ncbi:Schlafen-like protein 3 [Caenorhabditis elegans]|uniref:Schlafen-like protein 3 n=1 Tax=Caenorhabditis elegans TaxID=6239 RepID=SLFL3_CAEEL|nr:Protein odr-4 homolog [Caenorhabditis elegans]CCD66819.1 Protein odr-4 homolog [Caenorhabditis elegans]|eukprot:NP_492825.3 Uncharacterized protein CELE_C35E7.8 [Caenorhabditis elegans]
MDSGDFSPMQSNFSLGFMSFEDIPEDARTTEMIDKIVFEEDKEYDHTQDSFRYGRVTTGVSYNLVTGKIPKTVFEQVKAKDDENDNVEFEMEHLEDKETAHKTQTFDELYESQMPKYFDYQSNFSDVNGIWTLLFDQNHYEKMSTFELQAAICAALNSKHFMMICVGIDAFNAVTGVEMSAKDRVVFRMALTRAVAGEFQPPLVKVAPKQLTGVSPMKRDISEVTSSIDVLFVPVIGVTDEVENNRFLIVVRVKEISDKVYQISSGRIYNEQEGRVVEMSDMNEAFHKLIVEKSISDIQTRRGSMFMLEPEPFLEDSAVIFTESNEIPSENHEISRVHVKNCTERSLSQSLLNLLDIQNIGWIFFGTALSFCIYNNAIKPLVK